MPSAGSPYFYAASARIREFHIRLAGLRANRFECPHANRRMGVPLCTVKGVYRGWRGVCREAYGDYSKGCRIFKVLQSLL